MSEAMECDRCGKLELVRETEDYDLLLSRYSRGGVFETNGNIGYAGPSEKRFDLCKDCHDSLQRWWHATDGE